MTMFWGRVRSEYIWGNDGVPRKYSSAQEEFLELSWEMLSKWEDCGIAYYLWLVVTTVAQYMQEVVPITTLWKAVKCQTGKVECMWMPLIVSGGYLPQSMRGKKTTEKIHLADWYSTFCRCIDPTDQRAAKANLYPIDSMNMWPLISGQWTLQERMSWSAIWLSSVETILRL